MLYDLAIWFFLLIEGAYYFRFALGEVSSLLKLTPLVTNLSINFPPPRDIFALIRDRNTPLLVPLLNECEFVVWYSDDDDRPSTETVQALQFTIVRLISVSVV